MRAYRDGGNAIDAAIAAAAVLTVVYPHNVALGGDLIALVRTPDGTVRCVNASGWAGAAADVAHPAGQAWAVAARPRRGRRHRARRRPRLGSVAPLRCPADLGPQPGARRGRPRGPVRRWRRRWPPTSPMQRMPTCSAARTSTGCSARSGRSLRAGDALGAAGAGGHLRDAARRMGPVEFYEGCTRRAHGRVPASRGSVLDARRLRGVPARDRRADLGRLRRPDGAHQPAEHARVPAAAGAARHRRTRHHRSARRRPRRADAGLPPGQRVTRVALADPRYVDVDVAALVNGGLAEMAELGAAQSGPRAGAARRHRRRRRGGRRRLRGVVDPERVPRLRVGTDRPGHRRSCSTTAERASRSTTPRPT